MEEANHTHCPNCESEHVQRFCASCGQSVPRSTDYALRAQVTEFASQFTDVDGKAWRTLRTLLARPGGLTLDHFGGRRARYLRPLQLFLLTNVLLFISSPTVPLFSYSLEKYLRYAPPSPALVDAFVRRVTPAGHSHRAGAGAEEFSAFAARFDSRVETQRKGLVITLAPALALVLYAIFARVFSGGGEPRRYGAHLVFALHYLAFLWLFLTAVGATSALYHLTSPTRQGAVLALRVAATTAFVTLPVGYLFLAVRRAYGLRRLRAVTVTGVLVSAFFLLLVLYRGALFFVAFYSL